jgi:inositol-phosphate phosphatase / L-galactose 1-phosphate phosphatase / histidinol-phosphatase
MTSHTPLITFAHELAEAAGAAIRPYFGAHGAVEAKADFSPVTEADRAAEHVMRERIRTRFPTHGIYGEEFGTSHHASRSTHHDLLWLLDPIDGTRAFIAGKKEWGTLIALCEHGVPVLGVMYQPITNERWSAVRDEPSCYNTDKEMLDIRPHGQATVKESSLSTTSIPYFTLAEAARFARLREACASFTEGGDCYAYGLLARGERDIVVDAGLKPYDILALVPIIEQVGGVITDWEGAPVTLDNHQRALAARTPGLHRQALALLRGA